MYGYRNINIILHRLLCNGASILLGVVNFDRPTSFPFIYIGMAFTDIYVGIAFTDIHIHSEEQPCQSGWERVDAFMRAADAS
jgi:hypothetical protein